PLLWRFPVGTGYGTLQYVEPLYRTQNYYGYNADVFVDHAHNDYLEALVEGGIIRLAFTLGLVYFLMRYGFRALRRHANHSPGRLAFGALIAVTAVAIHSTVDFGTYTPAVTVLAAVVAAYLAGMSRTDPASPPGPESRNVVSLPIGGMGGVLGGVGLAILALLLFLHGYQWDRAARLRVAAGQAMGTKKSTPDPNLSLP